MPAGLLFASGRERAGRQFAGSGGSAARRVERMKSLARMEALWRYRGFVIGSVKRDYHQRYRRSALGALWTILQPLATVLIYALVFSQLMRIRLPELDDTFSYSIYICTGIIVWNLFASISS